MPSAITEKDQDSSRFESNNEGSSEDLVHLSSIEITLSSPRISDEEAGESSSRRNASTSLSFSNGIASSTHNGNGVESQLPLVDLRLESKKKNSMRMGLLEEAPSTSQHVVQHSGDTLMNTGFQIEDVSRGRAPSSDASNQDAAAACSRFRKMYPFVPEEIVTAYGKERMLYMKKMRAWRPGSPKLFTQDNQRGGPLREALKQVYIDEHPIQVHPFRDSVSAVPPDTRSETRETSICVETASESREVSEELREPVEGPQQSQEQAESSDRLERPGEEEMSEDALLAPIDEPVQEIFDEEFLLSDPTTDVAFRDVSPAAVEALASIATSSEPAVESSEKLELGQRHSNGSNPEPIPLPDSDSSEVVPVVPPVITGARRRKQGVVRRKNEKLENERMAREWEEIATFRRTSIASFSSRGTPADTPVREYSLMDDLPAETSETPTPIEMPSENSRARKVEVAIKRVVRSEEEPKKQRERRPKNATKSRVQPRRGRKKEPVEAPEEQSASTSSGFRADSLEPLRETPQLENVIPDLNESVTPPLNAEDLLNDPREIDPLLDAEDGEQYTAEQLLGEAALVVPEIRSGSEKRKRRRPNRFREDVTPEKNESNREQPEPKPSRKRAKREVNIEVPLVKGVRNKRTYISVNNPNPRIREANIEENTEPVRLTGVAGRDVSEEADDSFEEILPVLFGKRAVRTVPAQVETETEAGGREGTSNEPRQVRVKSEMPDEGYEAPATYRKSKKSQREELQNRIKQEDDADALPDTELQVVMTKIAMKREIDEENEECMIVQANYMCQRNAVDEEPETSLPKRILEPEDITNQSVVTKKLLDLINEYFMSDPEKFCAISLILENDTGRMGRVFKSSAEVVNRTSEFSEEFIEYLASSPRNLSYLEMPDTTYNSFSNTLRSKTSILLANHKITPNILYRIVEKINNLKSNFRNGLPEVLSNENNRDAIEATEKILIGRYIDCVMKLTAQSQLTWATEGHVKRRLELIYFGWRMFLGSGGFLKILLSLNRDDVRPIDEEFRIYTSEYLEEIEANHCRAVELLNMSEAQLFDSIRTNSGVSDAQLEFLDDDIRGEETLRHKQKCTPCLCNEQNTLFSTLENLELHEKLHPPSHECPQCYEEFTDFEMVIHRTLEHCSLRS